MEVKVKIQVNIQRPDISYGKLVIYEGSKEVVDIEKYKLVSNDTIDYYLIPKEIFIFIKDISENLETPSKIYYSTKHFLILAIESNKYSIGAVDNCIASYSEEESEEEKIGITTVTYYIKEQLEEHDIDTVDVSSTLSIEKVEDKDGNKPTININEDGEYQMTPIENGDEFYIKTNSNIKVTFKLLSNQILGLRSDDIILSAKLKKENEQWFTVYEGSPFDITKDTEENKEIPLEIILATSFGVVPIVNFSMFLEIPTIFKYTSDDKYEDITGNTYFITDLNLGKDFNQSSLLFKSQYSFGHKYIEQKDQRLFLGNYNQRNITQSAQQAIFNAQQKEDKPQMVISNLIEKRQEVQQGTQVGWYNYLPNMNLNSQQKHTFKKGEQYYFGLVFIDNRGNYSSVYPLRDNPVKTSFDAYFTSNNTLNKPVFELRISGDYTQSLLDQDIIGVMPVCAINTSNNVILQGIPSRVMTHNDNSIQYSWYLRWLGENNGEMYDSEIPSRMPMPILLQDYQDPNKDTDNVYTPLRYYRKYYAKPLFNKFTDEDYTLDQHIEQIYTYFKSLTTESAHRKNIAYWVVENTWAAIKNIVNIKQIENSVEFINYRNYLFAELDGDIQVAGDEKYSLDTVENSFYKNLPDSAYTDGIKEELNWHVEKNKHYYTINSPELDLNYYNKKNDLAITQLRVINYLSNNTWRNNLIAQFEGAKYLNSDVMANAVNARGTILNWVSGNYRGLFWDTNTGVLSSFAGKYASQDLKASQITEFRFTDGYYFKAYVPMGYFDESDNNWQEDLKYDGSYRKLLIYPWNKARPSVENGTLYKWVFNCLYFPSSQPSYSNELDTATVVDYNVYKQGTPNGIRFDQQYYLGNTDILLNTANGYREFFSTPWSSLGDNERCNRIDADNSVWGQFIYTSSNFTAVGTTLYNGVVQKDYFVDRIYSPYWVRMGEATYNGFHNDETHDSIPMKYKVEPHIICKLNKSIDSEQGLPIVEFYTDIPEDNTDTISVLKNKLWIRCGDIRRIRKEHNCVITFEEGDYFYGRYDFLRTFPYSEKEVNNITEVVSVPISSRINLDSRTDGNRGIEDSTVSDVNFNLFNSVYNQLNNYFNFHYIDLEDDIIDRTFSSSIQWSMNKTYGSEIDEWCNIQDVNTLDLDGDKGEVVAIVNFNDNLLVFQRQGISQILYNENLSTDSTAGVSIELLNSNVVNGKRTIKSNMGCQNPKAVCKTPNGVVFIDAINKTILMLSTDNRGAVNVIDLCAQTSMKSWAMNNLTEDWVCYYDIYTQEVIFTKKGGGKYDCIIYNMLGNNFACFASYEGKQWSFNLNGRQYLFSDNSIWLKNSYGSYKFFDEYKPLEIELIANPTPVTDKTFTNITYRADVFDNNDKYLNQETFNKLRVTTEYQDTEEINLVNEDYKPSNLKKKFRIWGIDIPRNQGTRDRIRNPWCHIFLKYDKKNDDIKTFKFYDAQITYMEP